MTNSISRRSIAKGAAWAAPVVALAAAAPTASASVIPPAGCFLTDAQLNAGVCSAQSIQVIGARSFSSTIFANVSTANNFALKATCNYKGSVSVYFYSPGSKLGSMVPRPTAQLTNGTTYIGTSTLGQIGSGFAQTGFDMSTTILWENSSGSNIPASKWTGAIITIPFDWYYTAPDGTLHHCTYALRYTMGTPFSGLVAGMVNPTIISL